MTLEVRGGRRVEEAVEWLLRSPREELVALFGQSSPRDGGWMFLTQEIERAPEQFLTRSKHGLAWQAELTRAWSHHSADEQRGIVLLHAHPHRRRVAMSSTDKATADRVLAHFAMVAPDLCHGYGVVGFDCIDGLFQGRGSRGTWSELRTTGGPLRRWASAYETGVEAGFTPGDRQIKALGVSGQGRLRKARVAIVGVGGGGSMAAEQLAHMGVGELVLVDGDELKSVNLSRQALAKPADVGSLKVEIVAAALREQTPELGITTLPETFPGEVSYRVLKSVDVILACVDGAHSRHELNRFARRHCVPLIDIGATIRVDEGRLAGVAGHIVRAMPDGACLECEGLTSPSLREAELNGHHVPYREGGEEEGAPQIMSVNGILASAACTEILRLITGFSDCASTVHWRYDAVDGELYPRESLRPGCPSCRLSNLGDAEA